MYSFAVLSELLPNYCYIVGDDEGRLGLITEECWKDIADTLPKGPKVIKAPLACGGYFKLFIPVESQGPLQLTFEEVVVELQKCVIENRWMIRCAFSKRANTWVVLDWPVKDMDWPEIPYV